MQTYSFFELLLARDPRKTVQYPEAPLDKALAEWSALQERFGALVDKARQADTIRETAPPAADSQIPANSEIAGSIAALATNVWRAKAKMVDSSTGEPTDEMRRPFRHVAGALDSFEQMGVILSDYLNQPYDPGLPVKVITYQPTPEVTRDTIIEVIRPSIFWKGSLIQMGEVVVGVPESLTPQSI